MKYITKSLMFIALCFVSLVLSSYTVYGHNSGNIKGDGGYNYYSQTKNYRLGKNLKRDFKRNFRRNYSRSLRDYYFNNKKDYGIYRRFNRYRLGDRYRPYRYRRYDCR